MKRKFGSRQILLLLLIVIVALLPLYVQSTYTITICIMTFYMASASLAWSVLGGLTGQISLGHAAFMGLGAYISTLLLVNFNVSPWISILIVFVVVGAITALLLSPCFGLRGPYFTLVTIAFGETFRNLFTNWEYAGKERNSSPIRRGRLWADAVFSKQSYFYLGLGYGCIDLYHRKND